MKKVLTKKVIKTIENEAKKFFEDSSWCHDWTHIDRVRNIALRLAQQEKADKFVVETAALLHDIGRSDEMKSKGAFCHAEISVQLAKKILLKHKFSEKQRENILHCIISHRIRNNHQPATIEAKVLFDADKLDAIGAVGIARDFLFAGYLKNGQLYTGREKQLAKTGKCYDYSCEDTAILEYEIDLKYIWKRMLTKAGKEFARSRHEFMTGYFKRFWQEVDGLK